MREMEINTRKEREKERWEEREREREGQIGREKLLIYPDITEFGGEEEGEEGGERKDWKREGGT